MEIAKNTTILDKKSLISFQRIEIWKKSWLIGVLALALMALAFTIQEGQVVLKSIPFLVIGAAVFPVYIILLELIFLKQNKNFQTTTLEYTFTENKLIVKGQNATSKEETELTYESLTKVSQTKKYIYLYINKVSALVVDKRSFTLGSSEKLINLLNLKRKNKNRA